MRIPMASILSLVLVAGCGNGGTTPTLHLDGGSGSKDMAMSNNSPDLSMAQNSPDMAMPGPCDLIKQDCTDQTNTKCAAVDDGTGMSLTSMCVAPTGNMMTEDSCTRKDNTPSGEGYDDCAAGNYCSGLGTLSTPPVRHCRNFCLLDTDCTHGVNEKCVGLIVNQAMNAFTMGLCAPTCTPFGNDCGQGLNCSNLLPAVDMSNEYLACRQPGQVGTSGACTTDSDCVADAVCVTPTMGNAICSALCDMGAHPCANGKTCTMIPNSTLMVCV